MSEIAANHNKDGIGTRELFDLDHTLAKELLWGLEYPYLALPLIKEYIRGLFATLPENEYTEISPEVYVANDAKIYPTATIEGPSIIGHGTEVRPGAFIRGSALIGNGVVVGNSTEIKNAIVFDNVQIPHYNYVGDSILGYRSHMGAGAIASNFKLDHSNIKIKCDGGYIETGLRKFGVMLGDYSEVGCGSILNPGTVIGRECLIYPRSVIRGIIPAGSIVGNQGEIKKRR
jgi:NDP-sugar pyrophosphorylase family protein